LTFSPTYFTIMSTNLTRPNIFFHEIFIKIYGLRNMSLFFPNHIFYLFFIRNRWNFCKMLNQLILKSKIKKCNLSTKSVAEMFTLVLHSNVETRAVSPRWVDRVPIRKLEILTRIEYTRLLEIWLTLILLNFWLFIASY
jgi:hypothetical protein